MRYTNYVGKSKIRNPIIGLTTGLLKEDPQRKIPTPKETCYIKTEYINAVERHGGYPILIPVTMEISSLRNLLNAFDGIILTGGGDIDPSFYQEELKYKALEFNTKRDEIELWIARNFPGPILGICRGMQVINVAFGGTLIQDIKTELKPFVDHGEPDILSFHKVKLVDKTRLKELFGSSTIKVNSSHHQAVKTLGENLKASAYAEDGLIEAIESTEKDIIGVQWHPESLDEPHSAKLFEWFINKCGDK